MYLSTLWFLSLIVGMIFFFGNRFGLRSMKSIGTHEQIQAWLFFCYECLVCFMWLITVLMDWNIFVNTKWIGEENIVFDKPLHEYDIVTQQLKDPKWFHHHAVHRHVVWFPYMIVIGIRFVHALERTPWWPHVVQIGLISVTWFICGHRGVLLGTIFSFISCIRYGCEAVDLIREESVKDTVYRRYPNVVVGLMYMLTFFLCGKLHLLPIPLVWAMMLETERYGVFMSSCLPYKNVNE